MTWMERVEAGQSVAVLGGAGRPPRRRSMAVRCAEGDPPLAPWLALREQLAHESGRGPELDRVARRVVGGLRRRLLGDFDGERPGTLLGEIEELAARLEPVPVLIFEGAEALDAASVRLVESALSDPTFRAPLLLRFATRPEGPAVRLVERLGLEVEPAETKPEAVAPAGVEARRVLRVLAVVGPVAPEGLARVLGEDVRATLEAVQDAMDEGAPVREEGGRLWVDEPVATTLRRGVLPSLASVWREVAGAAEEPADGPEQAAPPEEALGAGEVPEGGPTAGEVPEGGPETGEVAAAAPEVTPEVAAPEVSAAPEIPADAFAAEIGEIPAPVLVPPVEDPVPPSFLESEPAWTSSPPPEALDREEPSVFDAAFEPVRRRPGPREPREPREPRGAEPVGPTRAEVDALFETAFASTQPDGSAPRPSAPSAPRAAPPRSSAGAESPAPAGALHGHPRRVPVRAGGPVASPVRPPGSRPAVSRPGDGPSRALLVARELVGQRRFDEAAGVLRTTLERSGPADGPAARAQRARLLLALAEVLWTGAGESADFTLRGAAHVADAALAVLTEADPVELRAQARVVLATIAYDLGDPASLQRAMVELVAATRELGAAGDSRGAAALLNDQAAVLVRLGDPVQAAHLLRESRTIFASATDPAARAELAETELLLARLPLHVPARPGQEAPALEQGLDHARRAEAAYRALGMARELAATWETMGRIELRRRRVEPAVELLSRAAEAQEALADALGLARTCAALSELLAGEGRLGDALHFLGQSVVLNTEKGSPIGLAWNRAALGALSGRLAGTPAAARLAGIGEAIAHAERIHGKVELPGGMGV